jgi:hypothetical protein
MFTSILRHFNKLLMALSIVDSLLIFVEVAETSIMGTLNDNADAMDPPTWYRLAYPYLLYPMKGMIRTATIYMVVAISAERFKAICYPLR